MKRALTIKLISFLATGGISLGIFCSWYFQQSSTVGKHYLNRGFKITSWNDSIWEEEYERYKKALGNYDSPAKLQSSDELKKKCKSLLESKSIETDSDDFELDFCIGRTKLSNWLKDAGKRIVDFAKDEDVWSQVITHPEAQKKAKEISIIDSSSANEKQKIKAYCEKINWNTEIRLVDLDAITYLCVL